MALAALMQGLVALVIIAVLVLLVSLFLVFRASVRRAREERLLRQIHDDLAAEGYSEDEIRQAQRDTQ